MKTQLKNGHLPEPNSIREAEERRKQLRHEIEKIKAQVDDPTRILFRTVKEYDAWLISAREALALFREEYRLYSEWVAEKSVALLHCAHAALAGLAEEVEFEPAENDILRRLGEQLGQRQNRKSA